MIASLKRSFSKPTFSCIEFLTIFWFTLFLGDFIKAVQASDLRSGIVYAVAMAGALFLNFTGFIYSTKWWRVRSTEQPTEYAQGWGDGFDDAKRILAADDEIQKAAAMNPDDEKVS